ncbi:hypothetical protein [Domibacillus indicus]|uniref:hypothetical protein n=1 Tax=Domibacillus indicus TaxID=1437523 RepID=UPI0006181064|nr:hypothetical protein [Domibacillus indicus]
MRKLVLVLAVCILAACNQSTTAGNGDEGSYAILARVKGESYIFDGNDEAVQDHGGVDQRIGKIQRETKPSKAPDELESNYFPAGSAIYSIKGTDQHIVIKHGESGEQFLMKKEPSKKLK